MKIIIAGGREFKDYDLLKAKMDIILKNVPKEEIEIVSGTAGGADTLGEDYAKENGYKIKPVEAKWSDLTVAGAVIRINKFGKQYNSKAGHMRNEEMAKYADACVCFWDGKSRGTENMIENAKKYNLKLRIINY